MMNKAFDNKRALWLPMSSIRAIVLILLLACDFYFGRKLFNVIVDKDISQDIIKYLIMVFTAFISLTNLMIGHYISKK